MRSGFGPNRLAMGMFADDANVRPHRRQHTPPPIAKFFSRILALLAELFGILGAQCDSREMRHQQAFGILGVQRQEISTGWIVGKRVFHVIPISRLFRASFEGGPNDLSVDIRAISRPGIIRL